MDTSLREKVDLSEAQEPFYSVITEAIRVLVVGLENRVEPAFRAMSAINWGSCEMVGEESHYVRSIHDAFQNFIPGIRNLLSTFYFRYLYRSYIFAAFEGCSWLVSSRSKGKMFEVGSPYLDMCRKGFTHQRLDVAATVEASKLGID